MSFAAVGSFITAVLPYVGAATSVYSAYKGSHSTANAGANAAAAADPFAQYRDNYATQLPGMIDQLKNFNGDSFKNDPMFTFARDQGVKQSDLTFARSGMLRSGNRVIGAQQSAENTAGKFYNDRFAQLLGLTNLTGNFAGANTGQPGTAGQLLYNSNQDSQSQFNNGLNSLISGARSINWGSLFGNPSAGNGPSIPPPAGN